MAMKVCSCLHVSYEFFDRWERSHIIYIYIYVCVCVVLPSDDEDGDELMDYTSAESKQVNLTLPVLPGAQSTADIPVLEAPRH